MREKHGFRSTIVKCLILSKSESLNKQFILTDVRVLF